MAVRPEWGLTVVVIASLAKDVPASGFLVVLGTVCAAIGYAVSRPHTERGERAPVALLLAALVPLLIGVRLMTNEGRSGGVGVVTLPEWAIFLANALVALLAGLIYRAWPERTMRSLGIGSAALVLCLLPAALAGGDGRLYALTGNPNRTILALVICLPCILHVVAGKRLAYVVIPTVLAAGLFLAAEAGSAQGLVAVPLSGALALYALSSTGRLRRDLPKVLLALLVMFTLGAVLFQFVGERFVQRTDSLSGRLRLFEIAARGFWDNWFLGTGQREVANGIAESSVHNTYLGILVSSGIVVAILFVALLAHVVRALPILIRNRSVLVGVSAGLLVEFLIQAAEGVPAVWAFLSITVVAGHAPPRAYGGVPGSETDSRAARPTQITGGQ
jgi:hypothetical protein